MPSMIEPLDANERAGVVSNSRWIHIDDLQRSKEVYHPREPIWRWTARLVTQHTEDITKVHIRQTH